MLDGGLAWGRCFGRGIVRMILAGVWMTSDIDTRIERLLQEEGDIRQLNDGHGHEEPSFLAWRKRSEAAIAEKLGAESERVEELRSLTFFYAPLIWTDSTVVLTSDNQKSFERSLNTALGILTGALGSSEVERVDNSGSPLVNINDIGATASSDARASVTVEVNTAQLRQLIAGAGELTPSERGDAIAAIPDDDEELDLERVDRLLSVAIKSKELLAGILGWVLANAHRLNF
jgi:hypothetical protein